MIDEDLRELYRLELGGRDVPAAVRQQLNVLKENTLSLYRINKKYGNSIKVQKLIELYFKQLTDLEVRVGGCGVIRKDPAS